MPDEPRLASRVFEAFESYFTGRGLPDPDEDPEAGKKPPIRAVSDALQCSVRLERLGVHRT